jgi:hypothetical protein
VVNQCNTVFVLDEVHQYCSKRWIDPCLQGVVTARGNQKIGFIGTSQTPNQIHNNILSNVTHFYIFRLWLDSDLKWLHSSVDGDEKKKVPLLRKLPKYAYAYYLQGEKIEFGAPVKQMHF